jgi:hypothetical protein
MSGAGGGGDAGTTATAPYISSTTGSALLGIDLTSEGRLDWAHWGLNKASDYNHKNIPNPLLWTLASVGTRPITLYSGVSDTTFGWSDGIPTTSAMSRNGVQVSGVNEGFVVTAPAGVPDARVLRLYVGVLAGTAVFQAKFSDPKADNVYTDLLTSNSATIWNLQVITITYQDSAPGTTMSVTWKVQSGIDAGAAPTVHLKAASLGSQ